MNHSVQTRAHFLLTFFDEMSVDEIAQNSSNRLPSFSTTHNERHNLLYSSFLLFLRSLARSLVRPRALLQRRKLVAPNEPHHPLKLFQPESTGCRRRTYSNREEEE
jgi:hypothetical protein